MLRIRLPDCSKLAVNWKNVNYITILIPVLIKYQMQFVYLRTYVPLVIQISLSLFLSSDEMHKGREEKLTRKKLNVDRQFFKNVLCNLIAGGDSTNS